MITKPPSLSKRPGRVPPEGANRYRLLFSIWNSSTLSYVTWQHMQTCLVVRNSFHMLPLEEKNWRRQQYSRARKGGEADADAASRDAQIISSLNGLPSLPEGEPSAPLQPPLSGELFGGERWVPLATCGLPQPPLSTLEAARCRNETFTSTSLSSSSPGDEERLSLNGSLDARLGVQGGVGEDVRRTPHTANTAPHNTTHTAHCTHTPHTTHHTHHTPQHSTAHTTHTRTARHRC